LRVGGRGRGGGGKGKERGCLLVWDDVRLNIGSSPGLDAMLDQPGSGRSSGRGLN